MISLISSPLLRRDRSRAILLVEDLALSAAVQYHYMLESNTCHLDKQLQTNVMYEKAVWLQATKMRGRAQNTCLTQLSVL